MLHLVMRFDDEMGKGCLKPKGMAARYTPIMLMLTPGLLDGKNGLYFSVMDMPKEEGCQSLGSRVIECVGTMH